MESPFKMAMWLTPNHVVKAAVELLKEQNKIQYNKILNKINKTKTYTRLLLN